MVGEFLGSAAPAPRAATPPTWLSFVSDPGARRFDPVCGCVGGPESGGYVFYFKFEFESFVEMLDAV